MIKDLLKDKVAVITGGTRGIGYAIAETFLEQGARVIICGSKPASAERAVQKLQSAHPGCPVSGIAPQLSSVQAMTPGWLMSQSFSGLVSLSPAWQVSTDMAQYYLNAVTGELTRTAAG